MPSLLSAEETHLIIREALAGRAELCRKTATSRRMSGPANASARAKIRQQGVACLDLVTRLDRVSPTVLFNMLGGDRS